MHSYDMKDTFQTWNVLDSFFREMLAGTILRVDRRDESPGRTVITYGIYEKGRGKGDSFDLTSGVPMFYYEDGSAAGGTVSGEDPSQFVYPDEILMSSGVAELRFRILTVGGS